MDMLHNRHVSAWPQLTRVLASRPQLTQLSIRYDPRTHAHTYQTPSLIQPTSLTSAPVAVSLHLIPPLSSAFSSMTNRGTERHHGRSCTVLAVIERCLDGRFDRLALLACHRADRRPSGTCPRSPYFDCHPRPYTDRSPTVRLAMRRRQPSTPPTIGMTELIAALLYIHRYPPLRRACMPRGNRSASCQCSPNRPMSVRFVRKSGLRAAASSSVSSAIHASCHALATRPAATNSNGSSFACPRMHASRSWFSKTAAAAVDALTAVLWFLACHALWRCSCDGCIGWGPIIST